MTLVRFKISYLDFTISETDNKLILAFIGPRHTGDRGTLHELITDGFLVLPFRPKTVDEDNTIRLSNSELLRVWRESQGSHNVTAVLFLGRTDRELVSLVTTLIVEVNHTVRRSDGLTHGVRRPGDGRDFLHGIDGRLKIAPILNLHDKIYF